MEIEVKARLDNAEKIEEKLATLDCKLSDPVSQDDAIWVEKTGSLDTFFANKVFLRIRIENEETVLLTAKKSKEKTGDGSLVKREHEVRVDSSEEARGILDMLGLKESLRVRKTRKAGQCRGLKVCIDHVEGLGSFIELEKNGSEQESGKIQKEMLDFLEELDIPSKNRVTKGYDVLLLENQLP